MRRAKEDSLTRAARAAEVDIFVSTIALSKGEPGWWLYQRGVRVAQVSSPREALAWVRTKKAPTP
jgi:hypothetical protein